MISGEEQQKNSELPSISYENALNPSTSYQNIPPPFISFQDVSSKTVARTSDYLISTDKSIVSKQVYISVRDVYG